MYSEHGTAGERGTVAGVAGRGGVVRSAVAVFVARRRVCLEAEEGSMNGLCLAPWCGSGYTMPEFIRVVSICKNKIQAVLFFCDESKNHRKSEAV